MLVLLGVTSLPGVVQESAPFWVTWLYILLALFLVLLNGFFVLVEFALVKIRRTRLEQLAAEGSVRASLALRMHQSMDEYLSATQLGITVASLGLGWLGEPTFAHLLNSVFQLPGVWAPAISTSASLIASFILITFLHILIGELAPKSLAIQQAERAILWAAPLMRVFYVIFYVPLRLLTRASNGILHLCGIAPTTEIESAVTEEELRLVLGHSQKRGEFSLDRLLLLENILDLSDLTAGSIMLPISQAVTVDVTRPWPVNFERMRSKRYSRFPVTEGGSERIIGMVHAKDLGMKALEQVKELDLRAFRRDLFTVRDTLSVEALLREFQRRRRHLAVVKDSAGKVVGIVTLEDILEELVGEIVDEFDPESPLSLADLLDPAHIVLDLQAQDSREVIEKMLGVLGDTPGVSVPQALEAVWKRERDAPTGLGRGIAVPHGRLPGLSRPYVLFARCFDGVDFKGSDGQPARLIFLLLTPQSIPILQVKVLARIAAMMQSDYLTNRLRDARGPADVMEVVRAADVAATL
ncbi:MAG: DUF21 domain-containing protein [Planctomycetes bacterium]|nr:DUF21 domain-containing protein [Planctomycetota bacterium]